MEKNIECATRREYEFLADEEGLIIESRDKRQLYLCKTRIDDERLQNIQKSREVKRCEYHALYDDEEKAEWHLTAYRYDDGDAKWFNKQIESNPLLKCIKEYPINKALKVSRGGEFDEESWNIRGGEWAYFTNELCTYFMFEEIHENRYGVSIGKSGDKYYCMAYCFIDSVPTQEIAERIDSVVGDITTRECMIRVRTANGGLQVIGNDGKPLSDVYDSISNFDASDLCCVQRGKYHGKINKQYKEQIATIYDEPIYFPEGLGVAKFKGRYGIIDKEGNVVMPFTMDYADFNSFSHGYVSMQDHNGKWGAIDREGNVVIPCMYAYPVEFDMDGLAYVHLKDDGKGFTINTQNEEVEKEWDDMW